jgi:Na+/H+-dicarboxylate symporter
MYMTFATMFIAQAYGIDLPLTTQILMLLTLMITSKGVAGVPRASLVVITATLAQFNIPEAGLLLILAVDHFLDMGRSATNVVGNAVASTVVAKWEGQLDPLEPAEIAAAAAPSEHGPAIDDDSFRDGPGLKLGKADPGQAKA